MTPSRSRKAAGFGLAPARSKPEWVPIGSFDSWLKTHRQSAGAAESVQEKALRKRNRELEAENQKLRLEREILKKAAAFFAKEQHP